MVNDPIVEEVRKYRREIEAKYNNNFNEIYQNISRLQKKNKTISLGNKSLQLKVIRR